GTLRTFIAAHAPTQGAAALERVAGRHRGYVDEQRIVAVAQPHQVQQQLLIPRLRNGLVVIEARSRNGLRAERRRATRAQHGAKKEEEFHALQNTAPHPGTQPSEMTVCPLFGTVAIMRPDENTDRV